MGDVVVLCHGLPLFCGGQIMGERACSGHEEGDLNSSPTLCHCLRLVAREQTVGWYRVPVARVVQCKFISDLVIR